jgi:hypothetical protein
LGKRKLKLASEFSEVRRFRPFWAGRRWRTNPYEQKNPDHQKNNPGKWLRLSSLHPNPKTPKVEIPASTMGAG